MILPMDALTQAIDRAGGVSALAAALHLRQSAVSNWKSRGQVPEEHCPAIETMSGVRCEQLRPDVTWTRNEAGQVTGYHVPISSHHEAA